MIAIWRLIGAAALGAAGLAAMTAGALAAFPERPITLSIGFSPGGSSDLSARVFAQYLEKYLPAGSRIVIENKPGADGTINNRDIASAKPDGYRLGWFITPAAISVLHEGKDVRYDLDSFTYIGQLMTDYNVLVVATGSPYKTVDDMIDYARKNPGKLAIGVTGFNGPFLAARELFSQAKVEVNWVPFSGGGDMSTAVLGGHIAASVIGLPSALGYKTQRVLVVFSEERLPGLQDIRTARDSGYDVVGYNNRGVVAPKGIPEDVRAVLGEAVRKVANDPGYIASLTKEHVFPAYMGLEDYRKHVRGLYDNLGKIWAKEPWVVK